NLASILLARLAILFAAVFALLSAGGCGSGQPQTISGDAPAATTTPHITATAHAGGLVPTTPHTALVEAEPTAKDAGLLQVAAAIASNNRGLDFYHKGDYDQAIAEYDQAIKLN